MVAIGKQLLMTRGALTTFIANDIAKYFAILLAMFMTTYPGMGELNIMALKLHTPQSAVLAAVIFNALIIIVLIPLALRGVKYRPMSAASLLRRNLLVYGVGGVIAPFPGIWLTIDRRCLLHRVSGECFALDELSLHGIERRQFVMAPLEGAQFGIDTEQDADEIFHVRGDFNDQLGARLVGQSRRVLTGGEKPGRAVPEKTRPTGREKSGRAFRDLRA